MGDSSHIYIISDLHMGDGSARDNFAVNNKAEQLKLFAKQVRDENAELIILGDLFEFWQASLSRVLLEREDVLDALAEAKAMYVVGNHDADLLAFAEKQEVALQKGESPVPYLNHPFFKGMRMAFERRIAHKSFYFMHGHEKDEFNKGDKPNKGRALTILAGMTEDWLGSPFLDKEKKNSVEQSMTGIGEFLLKLWKWYVEFRHKRKAVGNSIETGTPTPRQNGSYTANVVHGLHQFWKSREYDVLIVGHTHDIGKITSWYFNSGGWAEETNDVLRIGPNGDVTFHQFEDGQLQDRADIPDLEKKYGIMPGEG